MDLVVDTSVLIAVVGNEADKDLLVNATVGAELIAPASVHWEVGNAFSAMFKRNRITLDQARRALTAYGLIPLRLVDVKLERALEMSAEHDIYAYAAYLLACAERQRCPLLTLDRGLRRAARKAGISLLEVEP